jgi:hypothetical protein
MDPDPRFGIDHDSDAGLTPHPVTGVFLEHVREVDLRDVRIIWGPNRPADRGASLETRAVEGLRRDAMLESDPDRAGGELQEWRE